MMAANEEGSRSDSVGNCVNFGCNYTHISKDIAKRLEIADEQDEFASQVEMLGISITRRVAKACETARLWNRRHDPVHQITQPLHLTLATCHPFEVIQEIDQKIHFAKTMRQHFISRFAKIYNHSLPLKGTEKGGQIVAQLQAMRKDVSKLFVDLALVVDKLNNDNRVNGDLLINAIDTVMNTTLSLFQYTIDVINVDIQRRELQVTAAPEPHHLQRILNSFANDTN